MSCCHCGRPRFICWEGTPVGGKHFITEQVFVKLIALPVLCIFKLQNQLVFLAKVGEGRAQVGFANLSFMVVMSGN